MHASAVPSALFVLTLGWQDPLMRSWRGGGGSLTWLGTWLCSPCSPPRCISCPSLVGTQPSPPETEHFSSWDLPLTTSHILWVKNVTLLPICPVVGWGGGPGAWGEVNLIVVLYGHLNLPGLPPRAKNNLETQQLCPDTGRTWPSALVQSPVSVCQSPPHSPSILVPASGHDPLLIRGILFPLSLLPCTLQVRCVS